MIYRNPYHRTDTLSVESATGYLYQWRFKTVQFAFTIEDVGPAGLFLEEQTVEVLDTAGTNIPVAVTRDELTSQLYLGLPSSLPRDGSADGEYTLKISLIDKAGNRSDSEHILVYDSKAPRFASVTVNTDPPIALVPNRIAEILESVSSLTIQFEEATRVDFANTFITLMGPESIIQRVNLRHPQFRSR